MSYYFCIVGTDDHPLFEIDFGTSKGGGDGTSKFKEGSHRFNQLIIHAALDMVEDIQWINKELYLKRIDSFQNNHIHCLLTGGNTKFMLLMNPDPASTSYSTYPASNSSRPSTARQSTMLANNPSSQQTEDAVRQFMLEVYEIWIKCIMNPFYQVDDEIRSPMFRARVAAAGKKYL